MLFTYDISLKFGNRTLFDKVNLKFTRGNCYGVIGVNGSGKSSFLKILYKDIEPTSGNIGITPGLRLSFLQQNRNMFNNKTVIETVIMGDRALYQIKKNMDLLYSKNEFSESDGIEVANLTSQYQERGGWEVENIASDILNNLGVHYDYYNKYMIDVDDNIKVKVILAQSIFKDPDILILDEPTNSLDLCSIKWLENFLVNYKNTVIVVSHDRHFLDVVCTHICNIDNGTINMFSGNYTFWYESSQLANKQMLDRNKKLEEKKKELSRFIHRFSSNASKSKQATSRKKLLTKLNIKDIKPSYRKYPYISFELERETGDQILEVNNLSKQLNNDIILNNININVRKKDKIFITSDNYKSINIFYDIITNNENKYLGSYKWGTTINFSYLPFNIDTFFNVDLSIMEWLTQYAYNNETRNEENIRHLLGKMLFTGDDVFKKVKLLSGGEKVRCMMCKIMMNKSNVLIMNEPTKNLDIETITSLNKALVDYKGVILLSSQDYRLIKTVCTRSINFTSTGVVDKYFINNTNI
jgi:ATPase subunit of ABC transporter with duplicated ATPase domains